MRGISWKTVLFALCLATVSARAPAEAQVTGVMDQPHPEYDAKGLPLGAFRLKPALDVGASYDDNVYATPAPTKSDFYFTATPSFSLASNWSRHMLELTGTYTRTQYATLTHESRDDGAVGLDGRLDIMTGASLSGAGALSFLHEPRYAPDQPGGAAAPTAYRLAHLAADAVYDPARVGLTESVTFDRYDYDRTPLVGGGSFDNSDRNHNEFTASEKVSVELTGGVSVYLRGTYDAQRFDLLKDRNGLERDSEAVHADAGANLEITHLIDGQIFAGYEHEGFTGPLPNVSGVDYGVTLNWYPTDLLTVHLTAQHLFDDTTIDNAAVSDDQSAGISADFALLRDLILQGRFDYTDSQFIGIPRHDHFYDAGMSARWLVNRVMSLEAGDHLTWRSSNTPGAGFNDNTLSADLHLQL